MKKWLKLHPQIGKVPNNYKFAAVIFVTRAILIKDSCILAAQRPASMSLPFKWELPGGKMEEGEDLFTALNRETMEEFGLTVEVIEAQEPVDNFFRNKTYRMLPFTCTISAGKLQVFEHEQAVWQPLDKLFDLDWGTTERKILSTWLKKLKSEGKFDGRTEPYPESTVKA